MFDRSRAHVFVRSVDGLGVLSRLDRSLRKWRFKRYDDLPADYRSSGATELRELYWCVEGAWTCIALEDIENTFHTAYDLCKSDPKVPVLASLAYKYGDWHVKAYHEKDCVLKVGDGPDHELSWPAARLSPDIFDRVTTLLSGNEAFRGFLEDALSGRPDPSDLQDGLALPSLSTGFAELRASGRDGWTYAAWAHQSSPLWRRG